MLWERNESHFFPPQAIEEIGQNRLDLIGNQSMRTMNSKPEISHIETVQLREGYSDKEKNRISSPDKEGGMGAGAGNSTLIKQKKI